MADNWGDILLSVLYPQGYMGLSKYRDNADMSQQRADLAAAQNNPSFVPDVNSYRNPDTWQATKNSIQKQAAVPILNQLADYQARGWSSDPSVNGDEWTKGLLELDGIKPDMTNPNILAAVTGFAKQAQSEKSYAEQLQRMGSSVQDAASLSRFAMEPTTMQHLGALEKAPAAFSPPTPDTQTLSDRDFLSAVYGGAAKAETPQDVLTLITSSAQQFKPSVPVLEKATQNLTGSNFFSADKPEKPAFKTNLYVDKTPEGVPVPRGYVVDGMVDSNGTLIKTTGLPHKPTSVTSAELRMTGIPAFTPIAGAYDPETGAPILLNRKTGNVGAAANPSGVNVGDAKADQKNVENLVKVGGVMKSNEIEANKNFDQLEVLASQLGNKYVPKINTVKNIINNNLGAPDPGTAEGVAYEAAVQYARVVNKQTTSGALTDTAKREAVRFLDVLSMSDKQRRVKLAQYRTTMKNATASQDEAISQARRGRAPAASAQKTVVERRQTRDGKILVKYSDGTIGQE